MLLSCWSFTKQDVQHSKSCTWLRYNLRPSSSCVMLSPLDIKFGGHRSYLYLNGLVFGQTRIKSLVVKLPNSNIEVAKYVGIVICFSQVCVLTNVLYVRKLSFNLIYISKLSFFINCSLVFSSDQFHKDLHLSKTMVWLSKLIICTT